MNTAKILSPLTIIIILSLFLTACGGQPPIDEEQKLATVVATTMTAISPASNAVRAYP